MNLMATPEQLLMVFIALMPQTSEAVQVLYRLVRILNLYPTKGCHRILTSTVIQVNVRGLVLT